MLCGFIPRYVSDMTDRANGGRTETDSADESRPAPAVPDAVETTEAYEIDDGIVLYDAENPLAWVQASKAVSLQESV